MARLGVIRSCFVHLHGGQPGCRSCHFALKISFLTILRGSKPKTLQAHGSSVCKAKNMNHTGLIERPEEDAFNYAPQRVCIHDDQLFYGPLDQDNRKTKWEDGTLSIPDRRAGGCLCRSAVGGGQKSRILFNPTSRYALWSRLDGDSFTNQLVAVTFDLVSIDPSEYTNESERLFVDYRRGGAGVGLYCCKHINCRRLVPTVGPKLLVESNSDDTVCAYAFDVQPGGRRSIESTTT
ncbi:hypothetical protein PROFUN_05844 [Planoprotostelium fungivorum]|uniref:Uncharacterized protein n=1 Tax=Planoprotostelium fungivorum TaxID=1890364 RepID=A0A2P6NKQ4_9EUKA|nr:hypothetical protein PROFUN_05844 [Planoprotostelium fungivorum]